MAKRTREDFEPSSPESGTTEELGAPVRLVVHPTLLDTPAPAAKLLHLGGEAVQPTNKMKCSLPPHRGTITFASYEEYDVHYAKTHVNRCLECRKNFPTEHFLNLHIEENHDSLISVRRERGERTYSCFVEDCDRKCSTPQKRRMHLIDKHMFPKDYDFFVVNDGIDRRSSMLRTGKHRRRSSAAHHMTEIEDRTRRRNSTRDSTNATKEVEETKDDVDTEESPETSTIMTPPSSKGDADMDVLSGAMSSLTFVPPSVRFGRGNKGKAFSRS
ncbi:uncharacterized protein LY89DRAFT_580446 [Mollisia scopiformis]|uniref:C2H2-type domain-containing protein n=1 Tax=Mollisia scopiformis TaxID=149040 RepID=A0A194XIA6_MOLSC|nr:uncharacterized protein LY89DRAFT_580446 [Mollisia scopiformis]KUJ19866.1 hypothetical protein LY89DRAFT_580446 [Mollisia scopiformis]